MERLGSCFQDKVPEQSQRFRFPSSPGHSSTLKFLVRNLISPFCPKFGNFDPNSQWKWNIGLKLTNLGQNGEIKFRTKNFRVEECPGDDGNLKRWDYSGTLSWKHDPGLSIKCLN